MNKFYQDYTESIQHSLEDIQKKSDKIALFRLFLIVIASIIVYQIFKINEIFGIVSLISAILGFYFLVKYHEKIDSEILLQKTALEVVKNEQNCLQKKLNKYDRGLDFVNPQHIFSEDLDLFGEGSLFHLINRSKTKIGNRLLANQLLGVESRYSVEEKQSAVQELSDKSEWRLRFFASMFEIPNEEQEISDYLSKIQQPPPLIAEKLIGFYAKIIPFVWIGILISFYFLPFNINLYTIAGIALINFRLSGINKKHTEQYFASVEGGGRLMQKFNVAVRLLVEEEWKSDILRKSFQKLPVSQLAERNPIEDFILILRKLDIRRNALASVLLTIISPFQPIQLIKLRAWVYKNPDFFEKIFEVLGTFELYASLGNLSFNHPEWEFPKILPDKHVRISARQLAHPLINTDRVVANDFDLSEKNRISLITGSNMSGKSTFLRTIGINLVLAYAGCPVFAKEMSLSLGIQLVCYMRIKDSLLQNASTFKAEIERIKLVLKAINDKENALFLIDEMLRGTNSEDKLTGSMALMEKIAQSETYAFIATHDLRTTNIAQKYPDFIKNYFFEYSTQNGELIFDYLIKEGVCKSFNASLILESIGLDVKNID